MISDLGFFPLEHANAQSLRRRAVGDVEQHVAHASYEPDDYQPVLHGKALAQRRRIAAFVATALALGCLLVFYALPEWAPEGAHAPCPAIYGDSPERRLLPTLSKVWPDRKVGKEEPHPAMYVARAEARENLGPLFWAKADDDPVYPCFLVVVDASLAESLFSRDGTVYHRGAYEQINGDKPKAMKFAVGKEWQRQRSIIEKEVLTDATKRERAEAVIPNATSCLLTPLRSSNGSHIDITPLLRECIAYFIVSAITGLNWPGLMILTTRLVDCEGGHCRGFVDSLLRNNIGSSFVCLRELVRNEVHRRWSAYYVPGNSTALDPDRDSLMSKMIRLTPDAGRPESQGYLMFEEVVMNTISFISAGWETSTLTFVNTMWFLTAWTAFPKSQSLQKHLHEEAVRGRSDLAMRTIAETLRWRPPIPWHGGNSMEELEAVFNGSRYKIPANTRVIVDIVGINNLQGNHLASGWDPESKRRAGTAEHHAGGVGSRHCPGGKLAIRGISALLGQLMKEFKLTLLDEGAVENWLQSYTGDMGHDLCRLLFRSALRIKAELAA